jgi:hypothetical protein
MTLAIIVLVLLNVSTVVTVIFTRQNNSGGSIQQVTYQDASQITSARYSGRYFRDQLGLDKRQMEKFREINPVFRKKIMEINQDLDHLRGNMLEEMARDKCNCSRLDIMADSIGSLHAKLKKITYQYYLDLKEICDQQQQEKLEKIFNEMFVSDFRQGRYGKGNQSGRRNCN